MDDRAGGGIDGRAARHPAESGFGQAGLEDHLLDVASLVDVLGAAGGHRAHDRMALGAIGRFVDGAADRVALLSLTGFPDRATDRVAFFALGSLLDVMDPVVAAVLHLGFPDRAADRVALLTGAGLDHGPGDRVVVLADLGLPDGAVAGDLLLLADRFVLDPVGGHLALVVDRPVDELIRRAVGTGHADGRRAAELGRGGSGTQRQDR